MHDIVLCLFECGPVAILLLVWIKLFRSERKLLPLTRAALIIATVNAALSAWWFLYYTVIRPSKTYLPPWNDPSVLNFALFFFLAPIAVIVALCAMGRQKRDEPKPPTWVWLAIYSTSGLLFLLGLMASVEV
jgi:hypothetical protein